MNYKGILLSSSTFILLGACNSAQLTDPSSSSESAISVLESEESIVEQTSSSQESESSVVTETPENTDTTDHLFDGLITDTTFSNTTGYQAWLDYVRVTGEYTLGDIEAVESSKGSSSAEIDALFDETIERAETEITENEKMVFYRYPDEEGGVFSEISSFLAEITFYFVDDHLVFSSVTPGFYNVELNNAEEFEVLGNLFTVEEIEELQPQVFTVSEVIYNGKLLNQIMVPAQPVENQENVVLNAFYFFVTGEEIIQFAYLPFEEVAQDFPTSSVLIYNSYFNQQANQ